MRITLLCADRGAPLGGQKGCSIHLRAVAGALLRGGHEVAALVAEPGPESALSDLIQQGLRVSALREPMNEREIDWHLLRESPDLVYERLSLLAPEGARAAATAGIRHVYEVNAPLDVEAASHRGFQRSDEARIAFREGFSLSSGALCVSQEVADWARELAPAGASIEVEPNGAGPEFLSTPPGARIELLRRRLRLSKDDLHVGYVGSFRPWHDLSTLVNATARLQAERPVRLLLVGDGPSRNDVLRTASERQLGVTMSGAVPHSEVPAYLALCDVVVVPYARRTDYFSPLKLIEAMAAARPVVASATDPVTRIVRDGQEALLAEPGDIASLHHALSRLARDGALRARLGREARARVIAHHTWDAVVTRTLAWAMTLTPRRPDACET